MIASARKTAPTIMRIRVVTDGDESGGYSIHRHSESNVRFMAELAMVTLPRAGTPNHPGL
jgi:hypothetical protein